MSQGAGRRPPDACQPDGRRAHGHGWAGPGLVQLAVAALLAVLLAVVAVAIAAVRLALAAAVGALAAAGQRAVVPAVRRAIARPVALPRLQPGSDQPSCPSGASSRILPRFAQHKQATSKRTTRHDSPVCPFLDMQPL